MQDVGGSSPSPATKSLAPMKPELKHGELGKTSKTKPELRNWRMLSSSSG